jgi:fructokinase
MTGQTKLVIFGEALFDCFSSNEQVLGGAPFNIAWHLHALKNDTRFLTRVGNDDFGDTIIEAMTDWGMNLTSVQVDNVHSTGRVDVNIIDNEPNYSIASNVAYDFIETDDTLSEGSAESLLYHGTLALRNKVSRQTLEELSFRTNLSVFLDVNFRDPWWSLEETHHWLNNARWAKVNHHELIALGYDSADMKQDMLKLRTKFGLDHLIVTRGEAGAIVCDQEGQFHQCIPDKVSHIIDAVGAGDAFTAMYINGLALGWSIPQTLSLAQQFASQALSIRGATTQDPKFYKPFINYTSP